MIVEVFSSDLQEDIEKRKADEKSMADFEPTL